MHESPCMLFRAFIYFNSTEGSSVQEEILYVRLYVCLSVRHHFPPQNIFLNFLIQHLVLLLDHTTIQLLDQLLAHLVASTFDSFVSL